MKCLFRQQQINFTLQFSAIKLQILAREKDDDHFILIMMTIISHPSFHLVTRRAILRFFTNEFFQCIKCSSKTTLLILGFAIGFRNRFFIFSLVHEIRGHQIVVNHVLAQSKKIELGRNSSIDIRLGSIYQKYKLLSNFRCERSHHKGLRLPISQ